MKNALLHILFFVFAFAIQSNAQIAANLDAAAFNAKLQEFTAAQIIDVRTPGEFQQGIIPKALNCDISKNDFPQQMAKLDKTKAVFVYCLTGSRSLYAMRYLNSAGFKEVYNLSGGILRWRAAKFAETKPQSSNKTTAASTGMTMAQYQALFNTNKLVITNFSAEWCAPCKRMKPFFDEIARDYKDKVIVVRIDADANKQLLNELKVDNVPLVSIFKNKKQVWTHKGFVSKEELIKRIKAL